MDKRRLLELAGVEDEWNERSEDTDVGSADFDVVENYIRRAARAAHRQGMSKDDFDRRILDIVDDVWRRMQTVKARGERVGGTPRY